MRTFFYTSIVVLLAIIGVAVNNHASIAGVAAISHIEAVNSPPIIPDTIFFEDGTKFTSARSLLSSFEGYRDLLRNYENLSMYLLGKGYWNNWIEKEGKIYLERTVFSIAGEMLPSPEEWQEMLEALTGEKFNEEGLLPANWLTGAFNLWGTVRMPGWRRHAPYFYEPCWERQYVFHFYKGRVTEIEITETGLRNEDIYRDLLEDPPIGW